nr:MAG TPA: Protein of unknown function (DUF2829) [Caudoviricetes sp.]
MNVFHDQYSLIKEPTAFWMVLRFIRGIPFRRQCWKENEFIVLQPRYPDGIKCNKNTANAWGIEEGSLFKCAPYLQFQSSDGMHYMWTPSTEDLFANDWVHVDLNN